MDGDGLGPRLRGRTCLVSGVASGQGRAAARLFARHGALVVGCDTATEGLESLAGEVRGDAVAAEHGGRLVTAVADITDEEQVRRWVATAVDEAGRVDVLYNNAARSVFAMVHEMTLDEWRRGCVVELDGMFLSCKHALPHMRRDAPPLASVINTASVSGMVSTELPNLKGGMSHAATKAGVIGLTRSLAEEYGPWGIRVNSISPGAVDVPAIHAHDSQETRDAIFGKLVLKRRALPEEVAACALFLASDESSYVTGVNIPVDGGWTAL